MQPQSSADRVTAAVADRVARWPAFPYDVTVRVSLWVSVAGGHRAVRLGCLGATLDRRRRPHRVAHRAKPVGRQRAGVQRGRAGRGEYLDGVDLPDLPGRLDRRAGAAGVCRAGAGAGAQRRRCGAGHAGRRAAVRAESAGAAGAAAARRRPGLHRDTARPRLRHLGAGKRFGAGLSGPAVVDDGLLVTGAARAPCRAGAAGAGPPRRPTGAGPARQPSGGQERSDPGSNMGGPRGRGAAAQRGERLLRRGTGLRRGPERAGAPGTGTDRRAGADHDADRGPRLAATRA